MNCSSKSKEFGATFKCTNKATKQIIVTTFVPHLNGKKKITTRCLCDFHAHRYRNKLNYAINNMNKTKSYIEENLS